MGELSSFDLLYCILYDIFCHFILGVFGTPVLDRKTYQRNICNKLRAEHKNNKISSSSCKDLSSGSAGSKTPGVVTICGWSAAGRRPTPGLQQQLQGSCARVRRIQNARRRNHLRMVRGGAQTHTRIQNARRREHLRMVRGGAQTHTRSAAAAARILRPGPQDPNARRCNHLRMVRGGAQTHTRSAAVTDV